MALALARVLVPIDFSDPSAAAVTYGVALADAFGAQLHLLHVMERPVQWHVAAEMAMVTAPREDATLRERAEVELAQPHDARRTREVSRGRCHPVGVPCAEIVDYAKRESIDVIVMGTHGRGAMAHLRIGSVAENVVRKAPCPVLTIPTRGRDFVTIQADQASHARPKPWCLRQTEGVMGGVLSRGPSAWRSAVVGAVAWLVMPVAAHAQLGWRQAETVSAAVPGVDNVVLAVDPAGVVTAVWGEFGATASYTLKASRQGVAGGWTAPVTLSSPLLGTEVAVAASPSGDAMALWASSSGIVASRYSINTGTWGPETLVASVPDAHDPALVFVATGRVFAVWDRDDTGRVEGTRYDPVTQTWGAVRDFGPGQLPLVGVDNAGNALVVWSDINTTSTVSFSRFVVSTGLWSAPAVLDSAEIAGAGDLRVAQDGTAALLWLTADATLTNFALKVAMFSPATGTWGAGTTLTPSRVRGASLALGSADVVVVWSDATGVRSRRYDRAAGVGWSSVEIISPSSADGVDLAADDLGGVVAVWMTSDDRVQGSHFSHGTGTWSPPTTLSASGLRAWYPDVVVAPTGAATVAWEAGGLSMQAVQAARWEATLLQPDLIGLTTGAGSLTVAFVPLLMAPLPELAPQNIEYSTDDGATWTPRTPASAGSPAVISGLTDFTPYRLRLRFVNVAGSGLASAPLVVRPGVGSDVPTGLEATSIAGNTVTLVWTPPEVGVVPAGYVVEGGIVPGEVLGRVSTPGPGSALTFVAPTGAFYVRVHAVTQLPPSGVGGPSNEIRIVVNVPEPPSAPRDLLGMGNGSSIALSWANTFAGGAPTGVALVANGPVSGTIPLGMAETFEFAGVPSGTYTLFVVATNAAGVSTPSNPVTLTFPAVCTGPPGPPTRLMAQSSGRTVTVSWGPPQTGAAATRYRLAVSGAFVGSFLVAGRAISGTVPAGNYTFQLTAENACGASAPTAPVSMAVP